MESEISKEFVILFFPFVNKGFIKALYPNISLNLRFNIKNKRDSFQYHASI